MGEFAEMAMEAEFYDWHDMDKESRAELRREQALARTTWKTRDGRTMNIADMTTSHLENTIKYLERNDSVVPIAMRRELKKRNV